MDDLQRISNQKLLPPAVLAEEDEFYAECGAEGINVVDRVNGKVVRAYPYWIDRPNCNWKAPVEREEDDDRNIDGDGESEELDGNEDEDRVRVKGLMGRLSNWWKRRNVINVEFSEKS